MIYHLLSRLHRETMDAYLLGTGIVRPYPSQIVDIEDLPGRASFAPGTYVVGAADRLTAPGRVYMTQLADRLQQCPGIRLLNHPARTLTRFDLLANLHEHGYAAQRVARPGRGLGGLRPPVFVRSASSHGGPLSPPLTTEAAVTAAVGRGMLMGYPMDDLMLLELLDTADAAGYYRKYAAYIVGSTIIARSLSIAREWMLKFNSGEATVENAQEELEFVRANPHEQQLAEIASISGIEYGRIDYAIVNGRVNVWEINLNPTVGRPLHKKKPTPRPPAIAAINDQVREVFFDRLRAAFAAIDTVPEGPAVSVETPADAPSELARGEPRRLRAFRILNRVHGWGVPGKLVAAPWLQLFRWLGYRTGLASTRSAPVSA